MLFSTNKPRSVSTTRPGSSTEERTPQLSLQRPSFAQETHRSNCEDGAPVNSCSLEKGREWLQPSLQGSLFSRMGNSASAFSCATHRVLRMGSTVGKRALSHAPATALAKLNKVRLEAITPMSRLAIAKCTQGSSRWTKVPSRSRSNSKLRAKTELRQPSLVDRTKQAVLSPT